MPRVQGANILNVFDVSRRYLFYSIFYIISGHERITPRVFQHRVQSDIIVVRQIKLDMYGLEAFLYYVKYLKS